MKYDQNSTLSELLASDAAKAVLDQHIPGFSANPMIGTAGGFTLAQLSAFPQANLSQEALTAIVSDLASI